jgi:hypothetical protein
MSWGNTGLSFPLVCRLRHCSWCFIVHRQLLGETSTGFIRTMHLPSSVPRENSLTVAARQGTARSDPTRRGAETLVGNL